MQITLLAGTILADAVAVPVHSVLVNDKSFQPHWSASYESSVNLGVHPEDRKPTYHECGSCLHRLPLRSHT